MVKTEVNPMMKKLAAFFLSLCICTYGCAQKEESDMTVTFYNAGKADAILIEMENSTMLIDAGLEENKDELVSQLKDAGVSTIDLFVITHFDKDHVGGADAVLENFDVKEVYTSYTAKDSDDITEFLAALAEKGMTNTVISEDTTVTMDGVTFDIDAPIGGYSADESNNSSLIIAMTYGAKTYLFAGDAENERIGEYLNDHNTTFDFIKMPHHGNYHKMLKTWISQGQPAAAVITNSADDPESEEIEKTLALLEENDVDVYQTKDGTVTMHITADDFTITQAK